MPDRHVARQPDAKAELLVTQGTAFTPPQRGQRGRERLQIPDRPEVTGEAGLGNREGLVGTRTAFVLKKGAWSFCSSEIRGKEQR